jgi:hypothetical protein
VEVKDSAEVRATRSCAISNATQQGNILSTLALSGGVVFAYGSDIKGKNNVVNMGFNALHSGGVAIAWNQEAGKVSYKQGSTEHLFRHPDKARASWNNKSGKGGIEYEYGANKGFIPLDGVTVE